MKNKKKLLVYKCNSYKKKVFYEYRKKLIRKLGRKCSILRKKVLKRDKTIEKLRNNNRVLAGELVEAKSERKRIMDCVFAQNNVLELKEKIRFYEKNLLLLNKSICEKFFPTFMACTEEFGRSKMLLNECMAKMNSTAKIHDQNGVLPKNNGSSNKINQVMPMVKGVSIHKPIIALKRFQLNGSQRILSPIAEVSSMSSKRPRSRLGKSHAVSDVVVQRPCSPVALASNIDAVLSPEVNSVVGGNVNLIVGDEISIPPASPELLSRSQLTSAAIPYVSIENLIIGSGDNDGDDESDDGDNNFKSNQCKKRKTGLESECEKKRRMDDEDDPLEGTSWMYCGAPNNIVKNDKNFNKKDVLSSQRNTDCESFPFAFVTIRKKHVPDKGFVRVPSWHSEDEEFSQNCKIDENASNVDNIGAAVDDDCRQLNSVGGIHEKNLNHQDSCQNNGTTDAQTCGEDDDSSHKNEDSCRNKEIIKPCFVPIGSVPVSNGCSGSTVSPGLSNKSESGLRYHSSNIVSNVVVSLERTDELTNFEKSVGKRSCGPVGVMGGVKSKTKGRRMKNNRSQDETTKENVPNSSINSDNNPGSISLGNKSNKRFLSIADSNKLSESSHENSSLFSNSSELSSITEEKRSLRTRGKITNYKEPDVRSKKRRD